jgi:hypothetical protein
MAISGPNGQTPERRDEGDAPLRVRNCSRVGMRANPPRARLSNLLRRP